MKEMDGREEKKTSNCVKRQMSKAEAGTRAEEADGEKKKEEAEEIRDVGR